jgi:uncharacterized membrane protein YgaE (UPF0421/DUF939 family)
MMQYAIPVMRKTALGGGVTILAVGTIAAIAAALITQFVLNNAQVVLWLLYQAGVSNLQLFSLYLPFAGPATGCVAGG